MRYHQDIAQWIRDAHRSLSPLAQERSGAAWGPVIVRHRTTRPDWFGDFDAAWAHPVATAGSPTVDLITASIDDLPPSIQPPRIVGGALGARGEVKSLNGTRTRMTWHEPGGQVTAWDPEGAVAVVIRGWSPPWWETVNPLRWLVHWSVSAAGGVLVHAACVGWPTHAGVRGVLVMGEAGYGKSTTTLACLNQGWVTCGDDAVAVFPNPRGWQARAIYAAVKTRFADGESACRIPSNALVWEVDGDKRIHLLSDTQPPSLASRIDLDSLVLLAPSLPHDAPWHRVSRSAARTLITPGTALRLPFDKDLVLRRMGRIACELPAYALPRRRDLRCAVADMAAIADVGRPEGPQTRNHERILDGVRARPQS